MNAFRRRLRLIIFLVSGVPLALAGFVYTGYQLLSAWEERASALTLRADLLSEQLAQRLALGRRGEVGLIVTGMAGSDDLAAAVVTDSQGRVVTQLSRGGPQTPPPGLTPGRVQRGLQLMEYLEPLRWQGRRVGSLYLAVKLQPIYSQVAQSALVGLLMITVAFGFAFIIAVRFERRVVSRVASVKALAERGPDAFSLGDQAVDDDEEEAELADLVHAVRDLVRRVHHSNRHLRSSRAYFMALINNAADLLFVVDGDARIRFANDAVQRQLGHRPDELEDRSLCDLVVDDPREHGRSFEDCLKQLAEEAPAVEFKHADGSSRLLELRISDRREDAAVTGVLISARDITDRKVLEEEVVYKNELLNSVFDNIPALVYLKDAEEHRYVRVNRAMEEFLGLPGRHVVGRTDADLFPADEANRLRASDEQALRTGGVTEELGFAFPTRDGGMRTVNKRAVGIIPEDGRPRYVLVVAEEATEHSLLVRELQSREDRYRHVVENASEGFILHDVDGRILDVNRRSCESLGYTRQELLSLSMADVMVAAGGEALKQRWQSLKPGERQCIQGQLRRKDGSVLAAEVGLAVWERDGRRYIIALTRESGDEAAEPGAASEHAGQSGPPVLVAEPDSAVRRQITQRLQELGCRVTVATTGAEALVAARAARYQLALVAPCLPDMEDTGLLDWLQVGAAGQGAAQVVGLGEPEQPERWTRVRRFIPRPPDFAALAELLRLNAGTKPATARGGSLGDLDPETARRVMEAFESDCKERLARMLEELGQGEDDALRRDAHALKSGSLQVGAAEMSRHCDALSAAILQGDRGGARRHLDGLMQAFQEALERAREAYPSAEEDPESPENRES